MGVQYGDTLTSVRDWVLRRADSHVEAHTAMQSAHKSQQPRASEQEPDPRARGQSRDFDEDPMIPRTELDKECRARLRAEGPKSAR
jgi:hypothetical protein